jgi:hypothetical protein
MSNQPPGPAAAPHPAPVMAEERKNKHSIRQDGRDYMTAQAHLDGLMEACYQAHRKHTLHENCVSPLTTSKLFLERGDAIRNVTRSLELLLEDEKAGRIRLR